MDPETSKNVAEWFKKRYREIDRQMLPLSGTCNRGCDWCCYQSIEILNWEEPLIRHYVKNHLTNAQKANVREKLVTWFDYFDSRMPVDQVLTSDEVFQRFQQLQAHDRFPCIFLDDHECTIYEVRPLCCRMHVVDNGPLKCKEDPLTDSSPRAEKIRKLFLSSITERVPTYLQLLNYSMASLFKLNDRIRPVNFPLLKGVI